MKIPEVIKIGGTEYSVKDTPELLELIQVARKEEKDKLYSQIQALESAKRTLEDEQKKQGKLSTDKEEELKKIKDELETAKSDKVRLEEELNEYKKPEGKKDGSNTKKDDAVKETLTKEEVIALVKEAVASTTKDVDDKVGEVKKELTKKEIADYRKELLEQNKGLLIEGLVPTNLETKEEVNKAIQDALAESRNYITKEYEVDGKKQRMTIAEYEEYAEKVKKDDEEKQKNRTDMYRASGLPDRPDGASGDLTGKDLLSRLDSMTDEEYAKHADQILREARSLKYDGAEE